MLALYCWPKWASRLLIVEANGSAQRPKRTSAAQWSEGDDPFIAGKAPMENRLWKSHPRKAVHGVPADCAVRAFGRVQRVDLTLSYMERCAWLCVQRAMLCDAGMSF